MNRKEFDVKFENLEREYSNLKQKLMIEYANSNSKVKIDDVVSDGTDKIKVKKISHYQGLEGPMCRYDGIKLRKDGTEYKSSEKATVYQEHVI